MSDQKMKERRSEERVSTLRKTVHVKVTDAERMRSIMCFDLSSRGCGLVSGDVMIPGLEKPGDIIQMDLNLKTIIEEYGESREVLINDSHFVKARLVYAKKIRDKNKKVTDIRYGFEFQDVPEDITGDIKTVLKQIKKDDGEAKEA